ncbi:MAG: choice-of-anchor L domain-containing protein, partial [Candidatus Zixiibacteriota bacterium]
TPPPSNSSLTFSNSPAADPSGLVAGQITSVIIRVGITPNSKLIASSVSLLKVNSQNQVIDTLDILYDDGDLDHGDEIIGDGIFSTKHTFNESSTGTIYLKITAMTHETGGDAAAFTPTFTISVVSNISDETFNANLAVQDEGSNKFDSLKSVLGDETQAKIQTLNWVKEQSGVSSADTNTEGDVIQVLYGSGIKGSILLYAPGLRGSSAGQNRQINPPVPPSLQTRGTLDLSQLNRPASSYADEDTIGSTSVLIYDAFYTGFSPHDEGDTLVGIFNQSKCPKFNVTRFKDADCTVEKVKTFSQYGTVYLITHGSIVDGQVQFLTGEVASLLSKAYYIVDLGLGRIGLASVGGKSYFAVFPSFITNHTGTYPKSLLFSASCFSGANQTMSNAFTNKGTLTYLGYTKSVSSSFCVTNAISFFGKLVAEVKKTGESFTAGQVDPSPPNAVWVMFGSAKAIYGSDFVNGDFETGSLQGWTKDGDGRVISQLVSITPTQGSFMGIISTGLGYTTSSGSISQSFCIPAGKTTLSFKYDFLSEEFKKYCGDVFQDYFQVTIDSGGSPVTLLNKRIDDLCGEVTQAEGIHFDQPLPEPGDTTEDGVWMTGWTTVTINVTAYAGKPVTLTFVCGDVKDSEWDTAVLLDEIKIY